jgi:hypothetical protein
VRCNALPLSLCSNFIRVMLHCAWAHSGLLRCADADENPMQGSPMSA